MGICSQVCPHGERLRVVTLLMLDDHMGKNDFIPLMQFLQKLMFVEGVEGMGAEIGGVNRAYNCKHQSCNAPQ